MTCHPITITCLEKKKDPPFAKSTQNASQASNNHLLLTAVSFFFISLASTNNNNNDNIETKDEEGMAFRLSTLPNITARKSLVASAAALLAFGPRFTFVQSFAVVPQQRHNRHQQQRQVQQLDSLFRCGDSIRSQSRFFASSSSLQMSKQVLVPIGDGSEEIETTCVTDTLTRFGADVTVASVMPREDFCLYHEPWYQGMSFVFFFLYPMTKQI